ncbi:MAG: hypothetical protein AB7O32_14830 [Vicinamibacterales bacterium]
MLKPHSLAIVSAFPLLVVLGALTSGCQRAAAPLSPSAGDPQALTPRALAASASGRPIEPVHPPQGAIVRRGARDCGIWGGFIGYNGYMFGAAFTEVDTPSGLHMVSCTNGPITPGYVPSQPVVVKATVPPFGECTYRYLPVGKAAVVCLAKSR